MLEPRPIHYEGSGLTLIAKSEWSRTFWCTVAGSHQGQTQALVMPYVEVRKRCLGLQPLCLQEIPSFNSHLLKIINYLLDCLCVKCSSLNSLNEE